MRGNLQYSLLIGGVVFVVYSIIAFLSERKKIKNREDFWITVLSVLLLSLGVVAYGYFIGD